MLKRVHHINFVVHDLDAAVRQYESLFNTKVYAREDHQHRPVKTARFKVGETWIVFIQPMDEESVPGKHLKEHGEGFFLISYEVDDINSTIGNIMQNKGTMLDKQARPGILNWQVANLHPDCTFNAMTQVVEEKI